LRVIASTNAPSRHLYIISLYIDALILIKLIILDLD